MGAVFLIVGVLKLDGGKGTFRQRVDAMVAESRKSPFNPDDWRDLYEQDGEEVPESSEVFEAVAGLVSRFLRIEDSREMGNIMHPRGYVIVTGGMSWGDSPTEGYDTLNRFSSLPERVLNAGGFSGILR